MERRTADLIDLAQYRARRGSAAGGGTGAECRGESLPAPQAAPPSQAVGVILPPLAALTPVAVYWVPVWVPVLVGPSVESLIESGGVVAQAQETRSA